MLKIALLLALCSMAQMETISDNMKVIMQFGYTRATQRDVPLDFPLMQKMLDNLNTLTEGIEQYNGWLAAGARATKMGMNFDVEEPFVKPVPVAPEPVKCPEPAPCPKAPKCPEAPPCPKAPKCPAPTVCKKCPPQQIVKVVEPREPESNFGFYAFAIIVTVINIALFKMRNPEVLEKFRDQMDALIAEMKKGKVAPVEEEEAPADISLGLQTCIMDVEVKEEVEEVPEIVLVKEEVKIEDQDYAMESSDAQSDDGSDSDDGSFDKLDSDNDC